MLGIFKNRFSFTGFGKPATVHDGNPIRHLSNNTEIMGYEKNG
jgi:hypothetical protein